MKSSHIKKYRILRIIFSVAMVFCLQFSLKSQDFDQNFKTLSTKDGLSGNEVRSVLEDSYGFIWFATSDGLNRWDGYNFKVFRNYNNNTNSIPNNFLLCLAEDTLKNIWTGTNHGGLAKYNTIEDRFYRYATIPDDETSLPGMVVRCVFTDSRQNIWIGTHSGLAKYNPEHDNFKRFIFPGTQGKKSADIRQVFQLERNEIIIQSDLGLFKLDLDSEELSAFEITIPGAEKGIFLQNNPICFDSKGYVWVGSQNGLYKINCSTGKFVKYLPDASKSNSINSRNFSVIFEDSRRNIWIGTENQGLNLYNQETDDFTHFTAGINNSSISNNIISNIYEDKNSNIWFTTLEGGVSYFAYKTGRFRYFAHDPSNSNSLSGSRVGAFCEDDAGDIWIGTENGGLDKYSPDKNLFKNFRLKTNYIAPSIMAIKSISKNRFYLTGLRLGLYEFNSLNSRFTGLMHPNPANSLNPPVQIFDLLPDSKGFIWLARHDKEGIMIYEPEKRLFYNKVSPGPFPQELMSIPYAVRFLEDHQKRIWIATYLGLYMYDGEVHSILSDNENKGSISSNYIYTIFEDANRNIWVGGSGGLDKLSETRGDFTFKRYSELFALPENVKGILEDNKGNLWLSSNQGITRFNPNTKEIRNIRFNKEVESQEFSGGVCFRSSQGEFYFGGVNGFVHFNPDSLGNENTNTRVVFTDFQLFNISQTAGGNSPLKKSIITNTDIVLRHSQSMVSFEYAGLDINKSGTFEYAYFMEGLDKEWNFVGDKRFATYTNLSPGNYIFRVRLANGRAFEPGPGASIKLTVKPPFWRTDVAYVLYLIFFLATLYFFRELIIYREKLKSEIQLEKNKIESAREAEMVKLRFFTNISHEFKTPLTLIKAPVEKLIASANELRLQERQALYHLIQNNSEKLLRMVNQLLDYRKLEAGSLVFEPSEGDIVDFCKRTWSFFQVLAEQKKISYTCETSPDSLIMLFDGDKVDKIVSNLLSNAFKFTPDGGSITLSINKVPEETAETTQSQSFIEIRVKDTGIGIPENEAKKVFDRFYTVSKKGGKKFEGTGIGLTLVKEFTEMHQGTISLISKEKEGSEFTVMLPIIQNYAEIEHDETMNRGQGGIVLSGDEKEQLIAGIPGIPGQKKSRRRILIVEDDTDLRNFLCSELKNDYDILETSDGIDGLEMSFTKRPDLILSDVMMPKMNGIEFCRRIKTDERTSHLPVILLTAMHSQKNQLEGLETGADDYIFKPFNVALLKTRVKNLLVSRENLSKRFNEGNSLDFETDSVSEKDKKIIQSVIDIVVENITNEKINADFISQKVLISRSLLYIKIEALTGQSVNEFIRNIRLKKSVSLLIQKNLSVSEVAFSVGFSSQSYFTRCFTKKFGKSPKEIQEKGSI